MRGTPKELFPVIVLKFSDILSSEVSSLDPSQDKIIIKIPALDNEVKGIYKISEF